MCPFIIMNHSHEYGSMLSPGNPSSESDTGAESVGLGDHGHTQKGMCQSQSCMCIEKKQSSLKLGLEVKTCLRDTG